MSFASALQSHMMPTQVSRGTGTPAPETGSATTPSSSGSRWLDYYAPELTGKVDGQGELTPAQAAQLNPSGTYSDALDGGQEGSPARYWWERLHNRTEGGKSPFNLPWNALSDQDQQAITDWFNTNLYEPASAAVQQSLAQHDQENPQVDGLGNTLPRTMPDWHTIVDRIYTSGAIEKTEWNADFGTTDVGDGGTGGGDFLSLGPTKLDQNTTNKHWYSGGQVSTLYQISPEIAGHYGIDQTAVNYVNQSNANIQAQREATHDKHFAQEAGFVTSVIGGMALAGTGLLSNVGSAAVNATGASGFGATLVSGAAQGAAAGGISSLVSGGDVGQGIISGAISGGVGAGVTSGINSSGMLDSFGSTTQNVISSSIGKAAGGAASALANGASGTDALTSGAISGVSSGVGGMVNAELGNGQSTLGGSFASTLTGTLLRNMTNSQSPKTNAATSAAESFTGGSPTTTAPQEGSVNTGALNWGWMTKGVRK